MGLLSTLVSSYDGLLVGQIDNPHLTNEDYSQIDHDDMESIDIMWALASAVRRAKDFVRITGNDINLNKDSKFGFYMSSVTCYNYRDKGHFARQCNKPKKMGNHNPFQNQRSSAANPERRFNSEKGGEDKAWFAEIKEVAGSNDESNSDETKTTRDESSGSESESTSHSETHGESDAESEEQSATQFALMVNTSASSQSDQVYDDCSSSHSSFFNCVDLESKVLAYQQHNADLISDLNQCIEANKILKSNGKDFQAKIELLNRQLHEAEITVMNKQYAITYYINTVNEIKKKLAIVECDYETLS
ncbi:hypothetical protein R6Q57_019564 [Mikania cordata]